MRLRVKQMRTERGWTVQQLAKESGMSPSYVSDIENGKKQVNARRLEALARAFRVLPTDLIDDDAVSDEIKRHLETLRRLSDQDRQAVLRHAEGLLPGDD